MAQQLFISCYLGTAARNLLTEDVVAYLQRDSSIEVTLLVPNNFVSHAKRKYHFKVLGFDYDDIGIAENVGWMLYRRIVDVLSDSETPSARFKRKRSYFWYFLSRLIGKSSLLTKSARAFFVNKFFYLFVHLPAKKISLTTIFHSGDDIKFIFTSAHLIAEQKLIKLCETRNIDYEFFVHSWDVPSSKPYFGYRPRRCLLQTNQMRDDWLGFVSIAESVNSRIVGSQRFLQMRDSAKMNVINRLNHNRYKARVLYATSQSEFFFNEVEFIAGLASVYDDVLFNVRVHPQEPPKRFYDLDLNNVVINAPSMHDPKSPDGINPYVEDLDHFVSEILDNDIVLCTASSMVFDALAVNKPVGLIRLSGEPDFSDVRRLYETHHARHLLNTGCFVIDKMSDLQEVFLTTSGGDYSVGCIHDLFSGVMLDELFGA